jgi:O-antigen ligase
LTAFAVLAAVIATVFIVPSPYMKRFTRYFKVQEQAVDESTPLHAAIADKIRKTSRGQMIPAAIRAWYSEPVFGIGPGMHKNVWPHIAASPDGDRELGIWPSQPNNHMHSYHVHSDWVQLLEEYGLVGFLLLLVPATCGFFLFRTGVNKERRRFEGTSTPQHNGYFTFMLAGLLAYIAMGFHSLGDFNLQIPAINWIFAVVITIPLGLTVGRRNPPSAVKK